MEREVGRAVGSSLNVLSKHITYHFRPIYKMGLSYTIVRLGICNVASKHYSCLKIADKSSNTLLLEDFIVLIGIGVNGPL